jgi:hypothetical protein
LNDWNGLNYLNRLRATLQGEKHRGLAAGADEGNHFSGLYAQRLRENHRPSRSLSKFKLQLFFIRLHESLIDTGESFELRELESSAAFG